MFSLVTLLADELIAHQPITIRTAASYPKRPPTFSDALALVRRSLSASLTFRITQDDPVTVKVPPALLERFHDVLCYAA